MNLNFEKLLESFNFQEHSPDVLSKRIEEQVLKDWPCLIKDFDSKFNKMTYLDSKKNNSREV